MLTRNDGKGFEERAAAALLRITGIADSLTHCRPATPRAEAIKEFWYVPPEPEKKNPQTPAAGAGKDAGAAASSSAIPPLSGEREAEKRAESYTSRIMSMPAPQR